MKRTFTFLLTALFLCVGMVKAAVTDLPEMSTEGDIKWYTIKNVRKQKYATYAGEAASMTQQAVVQDGSLFYFTGDVADGVATVKIHNAQAGELLCAGTNSWTAEGIDWYIAAKAGNGLSISKTADFSGTESWNDFQGGGQIVDYWTATDAGSIWEVELFGSDIQKSLDQLLASKDTPIFGEPMYSEEAYNAIVAAYNTFKAEANVANYNACKELIAGLEIYMPQVGQYYHIEAPLFYNTQGVHKALYAEEELGWKTLDLKDEAFCWTPVETANGLAWKNVKNGKYLLGQSGNNVPWTTAETAEGAEFTLVVLAKGETQSDYQYAISVSDRHMHANNHSNGNGSGSTIVSWETNSANSASAWTITVAKDPATLVEATVTYSFTYEGEEKYTQTTTTFLGEEWPAITVAFPYGVSASKPEGVVEVEEVPTTFYVKNALSGQYLSYDVASNLTAADGEAVATIVPSSVVAGTFAVSYPGPNGAADPRYVQCGSKGRFSGNKDLTENSSVYLYKVTGEGTATRVNVVEDGASYVFVAKCSKAGYEGYWMVTNELFGEGADLRMIGVKVSDELPGDEITFEAGDYSPVWTVGVAEVEEVAAAEFYVKNAVSGKYLDFDPATNLTTGDAEAVATISPSSLVAGTFGISYPDPTGQTGVRYVQCGSYGRFSGNSQLTKNSSIYLYKVTGEGAASRVNTVEDGASYIFVAECSKEGYEGYWMVTNELFGEGADLRMIGVKVSDELPGDEITFEQGEYSPVWTIKPVEKEEETITITKVIELEVGELPFMAAENVESIVKWYYAKMHSNYPKYIEENAEGGINWVKATVDEHKTDSLLWGFVGNVFDGIKLVNKATGHAVVSTGGDAKVGDAANATALILSASATGVENGFCLKYPNSNNFLNAQGTKVASWSAADAGSTFLLEEYVEVAELTILGAKVGDVAIVDGTATVSSISTIDVIFDRPVELAEDAGWATLTDPWETRSLRAEVLEAEEGSSEYVVRFSIWEWEEPYTTDYDYLLTIPEGFLVGAEDANYINAEITATITIEASASTSLTVTNVTVGEDVMEGFTAVATPEDMIKVNFDGQFYFQGMPSIVDAEGNDASEYFQWMNGMDVDGSNSYIFMAQNWQGTVAPTGVYTITLAKASFMEMMSYKAPAEDIVLTVQIIVDEEPVEVTEIKIATDKGDSYAELMEKGATLQLVATVTPENATTAITWSSDNELVSVSETGLVTLTDYCPEIAWVTITATAANGVSATFGINVYAPQPGTVTGITLNATWKDLEVKSGDTFQLVATVEPADATDKTVTWTSNADFATVDANGLVTFTGTPEDGGTVTITATASNGMTATCMLSVTFVADDTAIESIKADTETVIYDIHGRRVTEMTKGVYIVNGKKVIKK